MQEDCLNYAERASQTDCRASREGDESSEVEKGAGRLPPLPGIRGGAARAMSPTAGWTALSSEMGTPRLRQG